MLEGMFLCLSQRRRPGNARVTAITPHASVCIDSPRFLVNGSAICMCVGVWSVSASGLLHPCAWRLNWCMQGQLSDFERVVRKAEAKIVITFDEQTASQNALQASSARFSLGERGGANCILAPP